MARRKFQTRLAEDTAEEVDEYNADRGISQAEGIRRLIQAGLEAEASDDDDDDDGDLHRAAQAGTVVTVIVIGLLVLILVAVLGVI